MPDDTTPAQDQPTLPARDPRYKSAIPHITKRISALVATFGLVLALASLYLPWLNTDTGTLSAIDVADVSDARSITPVLFFGLLVIMVLVVTSLATRVGAVFIAASAVALLVLVGHVAFMAAIYSSLDSADPLLAGLPVGATVTWGPYVAALGLFMVVAGTAWAARTTTFHLSDI